MADPTVTVVPLEEAGLIADPDNARKHNPRNIGVIEDSMNTDGAGRSIFVDQNGVTVAGAGALEGALQAGIKRAAIIDTDGDTLVVVRRTLTPEQRTRLALADNRATELSTWDELQLKRLQAEAPDVLKGLWTDKELVQFFARNGSTEEQPKSGQTDPDDVPAERHTDIQRGDLFALGAHRLLCGDSTSEEDVARLMDGERGKIMNTDPPYGIAYNSADLHRNRSVYEPIENDELLDGVKLQAFLEAAIRVAVPHLVDECAFYLWHPMLTQGTFFAAAAAAAAAAADIIVNRQIIWAKPQFVFGRGEYHWQHELCFYGWRKGHRPPFFGERNQSTLWTVGYAEGRNERVHPTQKPVALFEPPMLNHTRAGDVVYEPFAGSGSQVLAAERLGRRCHAMELMPAYCQVIIDRWEAFTGDTAVKL